MSAAAPRTGAGRALEMDLGLLGKRVLEAGSRRVGPLLGLGLGGSGGGGGSIPPGRVGDLGKPTLTWDPAQSHPLPSYDPESLFLSVTCQGYPS